MATPDELFQLLDPAYEAAGMVEEFEHPRLGRIRMPAPPVRFSGAAYRSATTTPGLGEHTDTELQRLGYPVEVIERLVADGIVRRGGAGAADGGEVAING